MKVLIETNKSHEVAPELLLKLFFPKNECKFETLLNPETGNKVFDYEIEGFVGDLYETLEGRDQERFIEKDILIASLLLDIDLDTINTNFSNFVSELSGIKKVIFWNEQYEIQYLNGSLSLVEKKVF